MEIHIICELIRLLGCIELHNDSLVVELWDVSAVAVLITQQRAQPSPEPHWRCSHPSTTPETASVETHSSCLAFQSETSETFQIHL